MCSAQIKSAPLRRVKFFLVFLLCLTGAFLFGCGDGSSTTREPSGSDEEQASPAAAEVGIFNEEDGGSEPNADEVDDIASLAPVVNAGVDQFADANVILALAGSVQAQGMAAVVATRWQQLAGPPVEIPDPGELSNIISIPDVVKPNQLVFGLVATDSEGRIGRDAIVINIIPLEVFARVISTSANEDDGVARLRVELSGVSQDDTFLKFQTVDGSAISGDDFVATSGELIIPAGSVATELEVELVNDDLEEADETLSLQIAVENGANRNSGAGTLIIRDTDLPSELLPQTIVFADSGPVTVDVGATVVNPIIVDSTAAPGIGSISYRSSNPDVAAVDSLSGEVIGVMPGAVVITAFKEADNLFASAQASYNMTVNLANQQLVFEDAGPITGLVNDVVLNPVIESGSGTGTISFASSDPDIASIDADTNAVTLLAAGKVTITASKEADELFAAAQASYDIQIDLRLQSIDFNLAGPLSGAIGEVLINSLQTVGAGNGAITFSSSDTSIARVDETTGEVELLAPGLAEITATKAADPEFAEATATYEIIVFGAQILSFEVSGPLRASVGDVLTNNLAEKGAGTGDILFSSSDEGLATVDPITGEVSVLAAGTVEITATKAADSQFAEASASYLITITKSSQIISFNNDAVVVSDLQSSVTNDLAETGAGSGDITYSSSNPSVATVNSQSGLVTIVGQGMTTIRAVKEEDERFNEATASYSLEVKSSIQSIAFTDDLITVEIGDVFTNDLVDSGTGSGSITFSSADTGIVDVEADAGIGLAVGVGRTTITAVKAADNLVSEASADYDVEVVLRSQTIAFQNSGPINVQFLSTFSNPLIDSGQGTGDITYSISNRFLGSIDSTGVISVLGLGTAVVTATKAADSVFAEATASYTLTVGQ